MVNQKVTFWDKYFYHQVSEISLHEATISQGTTRIWPAYFNKIDCLQAHILWLVALKILTAALAQKQQLKKE